MLLTLLTVLIVVVVSVVSFVCQFECLSACNRWYFNVYSGFVSVKSVS